MRETIGDLKNTRLVRHYRSKSQYSLFFFVKLTYID